MPPTPASGIFPLTGWPASPLNSGHEKMAQDNRSDLARLERMERRLQGPGEAGAVRKLEKRYGAVCDKQNEAHGGAILFPQDAVWGRPRPGRFEGAAGRRGVCR